MEKPGPTFITEYYSSQVLEFTGYLKRVEGGIDMMDIHQLRVRMKRIKAVYRLLEFIYGDEFKTKEHYRQLKPVFMASGVIREDQINLSILAGYKDVDKLQRAFSVYLSSLMHFRKEKLDKAIACFSIEAFNDETVKMIELCNRMGEKEFLSASSGYLMFEARRIQNLLSGMDDPDLLHKIRIILKNIKPVLFLLWPRDDTRFEKEAYGQLRTTEKHIGHWHDRYILLQSLTNFLDVPGRKDDDIYFDYACLQTELDKEISNDKKKIRMHLDFTLRGLFTNNPDKGNQSGMQ